MAAPVFDANASVTNSGTVFNTWTPSWSHAVGTGANNCGIVVAVESNGGSQAFVPTGTPTASIGATSLTYLGSVLMGNATGNGFIAVWAALNVPTGSQTVTFTINSSGQAFTQGFGVSFTYTGVGGFGSLQTAFQTNGTTNTDAVTVPSATGDLVWGLIGNFQNGTYSGLSFTARQTQATSTPFFVAGDQAGSASVNFTATQSAQNGSAAVGLDLRPPAPPVPAAYFNQAIPRASLY